jgi:hypothetical protein
MGGADETVWHLAQRVRGVFLARPELAWAFAGDVAEDATECPEAVPAGLEGDLGNGMVGVAQQRLRALDPARQQVAVWRQAKGRFERSCEVGLGNATDPRQPRYGPLLMRGGIHPILCAQQPAEECRIPIGFGCHTRGI